jgi:DNA-binding LytR/AlgR family response regulator
VSDARLARTVERLKARMATSSARPDDDGLARLVEQMRALLPAQPAAERLTVVRAAVGNIVRMIPVQDVAYFQALDKYVNVASSEGDALIRLSLKDLLPQLDADAFRQISRGAIVNMRHVASASRDDAGKLTLHLRGRADTLRVSPLFAHLFRQM